MRPFPILVLALALFLSGCTAIQRTAHMYGNDAPVAHTFQYGDGGSSSYYAFNIGNAAQADTVLFFYGATGCPSWKSVMPGYVAGLTANARVFALNKRHVADRSMGFFDCGREFHLANNTERWVADHSEFIATQLDRIAPRPRNVVLVGVSEGAIPAVKIAARTSAVTHLAIIGSGGYSLRQSLTTLQQKGTIGFDVASGWQEISSDPSSIDKSWYGNRYRWWSDVMDIAPIDDYLTLDIPILVGIGEQDESVPVESVRFLDAQFRRAGKHNLAVRIYPDADHRLSRKGVSLRNEFFATLGDLLQTTQNQSAKPSRP
jgi:pimeloyl-ACP methyl ester carboxylesterase